MYLSRGQFFKTCSIFLTATTPFKEKILNHFGSFTATVPNQNVLKIFTFDF